MARNIEIKARIESIEAMRTKVAALADHGPIELLQDDTFFTCARGRLKLRALSATEGQLIFYQRSNHIGVVDCNRNGSGLQSAHFPDHILCIYPRPQDRINCD